MSKRPHEHPYTPTTPGHPLSREGLLTLMQAVHAKGKPFRFSAGGHSMAPFIRDGDIVSLAPLGTESLSRGDVVAFLHPETQGLCLHRVLAVQGESCLLKGDNLPENPDGLILRKSIFGKVTSVERRGRRLRLGCGPERHLIACLSRHGLLARFKRFVGALYPYLRRRDRS